MTPKPPITVKRAPDAPPEELSAESLEFARTKQAPKRAEITSAQEKAWDETRTALLWSAPAFSHILYTMMSEGGPSGAYFTDEVQCAGTDDKFLFLNPETFFKYGLAERVFIVAHEISHAIMNHCGQMQTYKALGKVRYPDGATLPYREDLFGKAVDYIVNDLLIESRVGKFNNEWLHDKTIATGHDPALAVFRRLYEEQEENNKSGQKPGNTGGGGNKPDQKGFDDHLAPGSGQGQSPTQAQQERNPTEWQTTVAAAMHAAKVQGKLPAAMEDFFKELLEPQISWADKIEAFFARKVGNQSYSWATLDRHLIVRGIGAPGRVGYGADTIVVAIDTSGSIGIQEVETFFGEVRGIIEDLNPKKLLIMWCDAAVHRTDEALDDMDLKGLRAKGVPGRGGTDFRPVFDEIANQHLEPEALVYLTDGLGSFPEKAPAYPVLWGSIYEQSQYPFGDVVQVPVHRNGSR